MLIHIHTFKCCYIFHYFDGHCEKFHVKKPRNDEAMFHFICLKYFICKSLSWYHRLITMMSNECYGTSNHQQPSCLSNSLLSATSKKTSKLYNTGLLAFVGGIHCKPVYSPLKGPMIGNVSMSWCHNVLTHRSPTWLPYHVGIQISWCWQWEVLFSFWAHKIQHIAHLWECLFWELWEKWQRDLVSFIPTYPCWYTVISVRRQTCQK